MIIIYILAGVLALAVALFLAYVLFLFICSLFVSPKKEYEQNSRFYRFILNSATAGALKILRIKVHTTGIENVSADVLPLFAGNHRSNYDPIIQWYIFRKWNPAFISKASNFKVPFFGRFIRKCCFMTIDRENPRKALVTINKATKLIQKGEVSIGVYPEGKRSKSGVLLPFHNGVFRIARKANVPIVVMSISGTEKIHKRTPFKRTDVFLDIDVIPSDEVKQMKTDEIGDRVRTILESRLEN